MDRYLIAAAINFPDNVTGNFTVNYSLSFPTPIEWRDTEFLAIGPGGFTSGTQVIIIQGFMLPENIQYYDVLAIK